MLKIIKFSSLLLLVSLLYVSCSSDNSCGYTPEGSISRVDIKIERLESKVLNIATHNELREFMMEEPIIGDFFLRRGEYPNDEIFANEIIARFSNPYIDSLEMEIEETYKDLSKLENELEDAFSLMKHYYPEFEIPVVKTVATGFDYDLFVSDSLIVIGLDFYMGPEAKFRPMGVYNYILKRYDQKYIVPSIMLLYGISTDINKHDPDDETILSDMISYGKSYYFAKRMLPCTADSTIIWYSDKEFNGVTANKSSVWSHFIDNKLLFERNHLVKRKYLDERPKTFEIGTECPARIATWVGWEIVNKYMADKPEITLQELMETKSAMAVFEQSKYRPQ